MIRLLLNTVRHEWMYGPKKRVRVSKLDGTVQRIYRDKRTKRRNWQTVDCYTLHRIPNGTERKLQKGDRFWTAMSAT
jgi:hypothetical protein